MNYWGGLKLVLRAQPYPQNNYMEGSGSATIE